MSLFEQYKLAFDLLEKESDRFWKRNEIFLLIQGALIAFFTNMKDAPIEKVLLTVEGFFMALMWIGVLSKGGKYVERWDNTIRQMEEHILSLNTEETKNFIPLKKLNDHSKGNEIFKFKLRFINRRTTKLIAYVIYSLMFFWLLLFVSLIYPYLKEGALNLINFVQHTRAESCN